MRPMRRSSVANTLLFVGSALLLTSGGDANSTPSSVKSVAPQFNLSTMRQSPFPSDLYTVADSGQNTGLRVSLPKPDCNAKLSDCQDIAVLNQLDGFSAQTRLEIPFDGEIDPNSANSSNLFFISLGDQVPGGDPGGERIGVNQVVWDPASLTLFVESDQLLEQHTRYIALVTNGIRDSLGNPIIPAVGFTKFLGTQQEPGSQLAVYDAELQAALDSGAVGSVPRASIAAATVFTTQSVTSFLEKVRNQIKASTPAPADFLLGTLGQRTVFARSAVSSIVFNEEDTTAPTFTQFNLNLPLLDVVPSSVGTIAFGKYKSPDYEIAPAVLGAVLPDLPTRSGVPQVQQMADMYFTLFLPASAKPATGWPVAIYSGHVKDLGLSGVASIMAAHGIATIGINAVGDGGGPLGNLVVTAGNTSVTLPSGGRTVDVNGDGIFESQENCFAAAPRTILLVRDCRRQMTVDLMQLVRVIQVGVDVDGNGIADLDPSRIYSFGVSFGGTASAMFLAVEPDVHAGVPVVFGGHTVDQTRLTDAFAGGGLLGALLFARTPPLLNAGPPDLVNGIFPYNDNLPLRNLPPVINTVAGAIAIQELESRMRWVQMSGDPAGNAPYLRKEPLAGSSPKSLIMQFAKGDVSQPNPVSTATLRAGQLADRTTYFRNDLAFAADPNFSLDPHGFLGCLNPNFCDPGQRKVSMEAQTQIAIFFASDGQIVVHPGFPGPPDPFFEVPIAGPLPEDLNFLPGAMPN